MKIALLNLPFDNNYGGNLQRYALIKVLQEMGHEVTHINLRVSHSPSLPRQFARWTKRLFKIIRGQSVDILYEKHLRAHLKYANAYAEEFYRKYIPHTKEVYGRCQLRHLNWNLFDVVVVGSDQVWRYEMAESSIGIKSYFLSFLADRPIKKIAYSVSLGTYLTDDIEKYRQLCGLYEMFTAVSFREVNALDYAAQIGWNTPKPMATLDPTLLLSKESYIKSFSLSTKEDRFIFCYILDESPSIEQRLTQIRSEYKMPLKRCLLKSNCTLLPIEEWVENIMNASVVVTDSYHGAVFSVLFARPLIFLGNVRRGNERITSLFEALNITVNNNRVEYHPDVHHRVERLRSVSLNFLNKSLCGMQEPIKV